MIAAIIAPLHDPLRRARNFRPARCGGIPPDLAWESLRLFEHDVLPAFQR
jgi:hypothetical protein